MLQSLSSKKFGRHSVVSIFISLFFVGLLAGPAYSFIMNASRASAITQGGVMTNSNGSDDPKPSPSASPTASPSASPTASPSPSATPSPGDMEHCTIRFSAPSYEVGEGAGSATITVVRQCDVARDSKVDFFTTNGTASDRTDYTFASGRIYFAAGETTKTFNVPVTDDAFVEGDETVNLNLTDASGSAALASPSVAVLTIHDNDTQQPTVNPIDDTGFFVEQHYHDFMNRSADDGGREYWESRINECGTNDDCRRDRRISVSAAFFMETEFQDTGSFVYRMHRASFGHRPSFDDFMPDRSRVVGGADLAASKVAFSDDFVNRAAFKAAYPDDMTPEQFVGKLMDTAGLASHETERQQFETELHNGASRSQILREVIEIQEFKQREYNPSFVLMQYFGYLRREPDEGGYQFWLDVLNNKLPNNYKAMVCAFLSSAELQDRFSTAHTHSNSECGQ